MTDRNKNILIIAKNNQAEALRMAGGLSLLSDIVKVMVLGKLEQSPAVAQQIEVLEFAEVPFEALEDPASWNAKLAEGMVHSDVVYML
jgi:hypothetical protein